MPPKRHQEPETESEDDQQMMGGAVDFARFTNPNYAREFKAKLPSKIRERVQALEALDADYQKMKVQMSKLVDEAEREFHKSIAPRAARRARILTGDVQPTDAEIAEGFTEEHKAAGVTIDGKVDPKASKGIDSFWLEALQHHVIIQEFITERDAEALKYLKDLRCELTPDGEADGFTIVFEFGPNPFFSNATLSKSFSLTREADDTVASKSVGTSVDWKEGKNLTVEIKSKKLKPKGKKGPPKFVTEEVPCESIFHFFGDDEDEEEEWMAFAETLKDKIIPFAVDYFTGEAPNGESDMEDGDEDEEEEEEEEEEVEEPPAKGGRGGGAGGRGGYSAQAPGGKRGGAGGRGGAAGQQDCKQQ
jgi:nucleosome assembly protein 1-like 1